jgi:hypothetical protein
MPRVSQALITNIFKDWCAAHKVRVAKNSLDVGGFMLDDNGGGIEIFRVDSGFRGVGVSRVPVFHGEVSPSDLVEMMKFSIRSIECTAAVKAKKKG